MREHVRFGAGREDSTEFATSFMDSADAFSFSEAFSDAVSIGRAHGKVEIHYPNFVFVIRGGEWNGVIRRFIPLSGGPKKVYVHYCILHKNRRYRLWRVEVLFKQTTGIQFITSNIDADVSNAKLVQSDLFKPEEIVVAGMTRENTFKAIQNDIFRTLGKTGDYEIPNLDELPGQPKALPRPRTHHRALSSSASPQLASMLAPPYHRALSSSAYPQLASLLAPPHHRALSSSASPQLASMLGPPYHRALSSSASPQLAPPAHVPPMVAPQLAPRAHVAPMVAPPHASPLNPEVARTPMVSPLEMKKAAQRYRESLAGRPVSAPPVPPPHASPAPPVPPHAPPAPLVPPHAPPAPSAYDSPSHPAVAQAAQDSALKVLREAERHIKSVTAKRPRIQ